MTGDGLESLAEALGPAGYWWVQACRRCGERCPSQTEFIDDDMQYWTLCSGCDSALDEDREGPNRWHELGLWNGEMNGILVELDWDELAEEWAA